MYRNYKEKKNKFLENINSKISLFWTCGNDFKYLQINVMYNIN